MPHVAFLAVHGGHAPRSTEETLCKATQSHPLGKLVVFHLLLLRHEGHLKLGLRCRDRIVDLSILLVDEIDQADEGRHISDGPGQVCYQFLVACRELNIFEQMPDGFQLEDFLVELRQYE